MEPFEYSFELEVFDRTVRGWRRHTGPAHQDPDAARRKARALAEKTGKKCRVVRVTRQTMTHVTPYRYVIHDSEISAGRC